MNRWLALISRIGTTLVAVGLALLLISLIPSSSSRVGTLADWSIPIGFVLAIPWLIDLYQRRGRKTSTSGSMPA